MGPLHDSRQQKMADGDFSVRRHSYWPTLFRRFNSSGKDSGKRLHLLLAELGMRQRLAREHLVAHGGVVNENRLDYRRLLQVAGL
jgi:hypothetical protein